MVQEAAQALGWDPTFVLAKFSLKNFDNTGGVYFNNNEESPTWAIW